MIFSRGAPIKTIWHLELNCLITKGWKTVVCIWWKHCPHNTQKFTAPRPNLALWCKAISPCIRRFDERPSLPSQLFTPVEKENRAYSLIWPCRELHSKPKLITKTLCILFRGVKSIRQNHSFQQNFVTLWTQKTEISSVMRTEWKTVRSKASFHARIYSSQDSLQQPKAKRSVFSSPPPATKHREQPCGLGHSQTINLVAKSLMYWCWWTSESVCCSHSHPPSFSPALSSTAKKHDK